MVTIKDVAQRCGLSTTLVSRYLNGVKGVSPQSRKKIADAIAELNYRPNGIARSLVLQKTQNIGVVIDNICSPFIAPLLAGIQRGIDEEKDTSYNLIFCSCDGSDEKKRRNIDYFTQGRADGIIIYGNLKSSDEIIRKLAAENFPFVMIEDDTEGVECDKILIDNEQGAYNATNYLIELGHRRIAHITADNDSRYMQSRLNGYCAALRDNHIPVDENLIVTMDCRHPKTVYEDMRGGEIYIKAGYDGIKQLLARTTMLEAVFFGADLIAFGAMRYLRSSGIQVPQQLSIIGFDDEKPGLYGLDGNPISTMRQPLGVAGSHAAKALIERLKNPGMPFKRDVLKTEMVLRYTCAPQF